MATSVHSFVTSRVYVSAGSLILNKSCFKPLNFSFMPLCKIYTRLFLICLSFFSVLINGNRLSAQTIANYNAQTGTSSTVHPLTSVPAGALLVLVTMGELHSSTYCSVSSSPSLTWTKRVDAEANNSGDAEIWTAVNPTLGNITVTSDWPGAANQASVCYV